MLSINQIIVWIIVGLIGGTLAGLAITWDRSGLDWWRNLIVGLAGAAVGGMAFAVFGIWPELDGISLSLRDVVAAVAGSLIVLTVLWLWEKSRGRRRHDRMARPS